ncbi:MAG: tetratricopeptide repeat protein [Bryobacteraceae bacterium]
MPTSADFCQQIGIAYTMLEDFPHAEEFYRSALRLNPQFVAARKNLATVLWFEDRKDESQREFLAVAKAKPEDPVPHLYLGLAAHARRDFAAARDQFAKAGTLASENPEVLPAVLESYLAAHDPSFPKKVAGQIAGSSDPDPALISHVAELFLKYGHYEEAAAALNKLVSAHKDSVEIWRMLAQAYDGQKKPEQAYRAYSEALAADPKSVDTYIALAEFASAHGNNDFALQVVAQGIERLPESAELRFEQGIVLGLRGDHAGAAASFAKAAAFKPSWNLPLLALAVSHMESGDMPGAVDIAGKARIADPADPRGHYLYALALSRQSGGDEAGRRAQAIAALRSAMERSPGDPRSHALLGQLLLASGKASGAAQEWRAALKADPENTTALYQLGLLLRQEGKNEEAHSLIEKFREVKARQRSEEESLGEILRIVPAKPPK